MYECRIRIQVTSDSLKSMLQLISAARRLRQGKLFLRLQNCARAISRSLAARVVLQLHLFSHLPVNPKTRCSEGASRAYTRLGLPGMPVCTSKTNSKFRLASSNKHTQAFHRFRVGSHSLPCITGPIADIPTSQRVCTLCRTSNLGGRKKCKLFLSQTVCTILYGAAKFNENADRNLHCALAIKATSSCSCNIPHGCFNIDASAPFCDGSVTQRMHAMCSMPFVMLWRYTKCSSYALQLHTSWLLILLSRYTLVGTSCMRSRSTGSRSMWSKA